jgi:hypothetical protein
MEKAIRNGIPTVFVEKPSTTSPEETARILKLAESNNTDIYVDYIELEHPAVREVLQDMDDDFNLTQAIHWRGKKSPSMKPFMRDDMVHDLSELFALYNKLDRDFSSLGLNRIGNVKSWYESDRNVDSDISEIYDVSASIHLSGHRGEPILLKGGFDEEEDRRYFIWVDDDEEVAYFANTLRDNEIDLNDILGNSGEGHMSTFSVRVEGENNINELIHACIEGDVTTKEGFEKLFNNINAKRLVSEKKNNTQPDEFITEKLLNGQKSPVNLEEALLIENFIKGVYEQTDDFDNLYDREEDLLN